MIWSPASEYKPVRKKTTANAPALSSAVGQLQIFSRVLKYTVMIPSTTPNTSRQLEPCATSQTQMDVNRRSLRERRESLMTKLSHVRRRGLDRPHRFLRRAANLDIGHRVDRRDVVVGPRLENIL